MDQWVQRRTTLSAHLVGLGRFLRSKGFALGPAEMADALRALETLSPFAETSLLKNSLKAVWVKNRRQWLQFDELYTYYWDQIKKGQDAKIKEEQEEKAKSNQKSKAPSFEALKQWLHGNREQEVKEVAGYSTGESVATKDFSQFTAQDLREMELLMQRLRYLLNRRKSRRKTSDHRPQQPDIRSTLRKYLRSGGQWMEWQYRKAKPQRTNMILICDVSQSMDLYSQWLVQFMYAFQQTYRRLETFVFSTSLFRITEALRQTEFRTALDDLTEQVPGWSGGTRIGPSLQDFIERYGDRLVNRDTVVVILSDGWDAGDLPALERSLSWLRRKSGRLVWLNPLAGRPGYVPATAGMKAALPYLDVFAPAHNLDSLRAVLPLLQPKQR